MLEKDLCTSWQRLDLAEFKAKTDLLSHGASGTDSALKQLGKEYRDQLKVSQEDIDGNKNHH